MGDAINSKRNSITLARNFCGQEMRKKCGGLLHCACSERCGRKEIEGYLKLWNYQNMQLNSFISTFLKWVRSYVEDYSMTMIDFVDWINSK